jgi:hypothetical protein
MKNIEVLLMAVPAVVMFGLTIYIKNIHEGVPEGRAMTLSWTYGVLAAAFFILVYLIKFATDGS